MASPKSKKQRTKPPKGRPAATSALTQPVTEYVSTTDLLSSFSLDGSLFAFLSLAIDKHRLRIYDTTSGYAVAEHVVDSGRVTAMEWSHFNTSDRQKLPGEDDSVLPSKKKRKKRKSLATDEPVVDPQTPAVEIVVLGLSNGTLEFFSPSHGRVLRTLSHLKSTTAILSVVMAGCGDSDLWTSSADGVIRLWNARKNDVMGNWKGDDRIPYSSMAVRPFSSSDDTMDLLVANHTIRLLSATPDVDGSEIRKAKELATFTGHASSIVRLQWDASRKPPTRFLSMAQGDRFVYIWAVPPMQGGDSAEGKIIASIPLDSDTRSMSFSITNPSVITIEKQTILTLSASGKISVFPLPSELTPPASSHKTQHKVPTLLPRSTIVVSSKRDSSTVQVVNTSFVAGKEGWIRVARLFGGVQPVFHLVAYLDDTRNFIQDVKIVHDDSSLGVSQRVQNMVPNKRYAELSSLAVRSGADLGQDEDMDDLTLRDIDGNLDVDLTELSLGQRLTVVSGGDEVNRVLISNSDDEGSGQLSTTISNHQAPNRAPANTLSRTLIQALHSSDSRLLETCIAHSDQTLIQNTVRRLPPQLALPLLTACVDRLGRGARAGNLKGGGGGASSQRASALVGWIKMVLAVHSGHLLTMPDLVARLSGLHVTLTARLALQESLLSLSGRLDMVLSQIELRSSAAPAPLAYKGKQTGNGEADITRYVEGESEDDEQMDAEIEVESGDEASSVEDIELGGDSEGDNEEDQDQDEDQDDSDDEEGSSSGLNGFIDDEAEEFEDEEDYSE